MGFPGVSDGKESACNAGDWGLTPRSGRSTGEGDDYLLQYSCLENFMDRGAWWATVHGIADSDITQHRQVEMKPNQSMVGMMHSLQPPTFTLWRVLRKSGQNLTPINWTCFNLEPWSRTNIQ